MRRSAPLAPDAPADESPVTARSRRRFARRQWARRWLAWKYVVAAVLVVALVGGAIWLVFFSAQLSVQGVDVQGTERLSPREIRSAAAVPLGEPLARVDLGRIRSRVQALAPVKSADVTREWPDQVLVTVVEREPIAVVELGGRLQGMDADGVIFQSYAKAPAGLPRVETSSRTGSEALREGALVVAALPTSLAKGVDHVEVTTVDEISLELRDGRTVVWGSASESEEKARVLAALLAKKQGDSPPQVLDVSVPGLPTTRD